MVMAMTALIMAVPSGAAEGAVKVDPKEIIFHHLGDVYGWEVPFSHTKRLPLPVIVRDCDGAWHLFSSARVTDGGTCEGFFVAAEGDYAGKIVGTKADGTQYRPLDLSITKDVAALLIAALVVLLLAFSVTRWYRRHGMKAPRKLTASVEALVEFVYLGVIRPTLGVKAKTFAPYLLTAFFFIFVMNLLGLIVIFPGGANLTGNIAITLVMAVCTFLITNLCGNKHYWKDIFWPDVPLWLKFPLPIMPLIEVFGMFTKPAALCIRLFANMMGGHMIVIVLTLIIFIFYAQFGAWVASGITVFSVAFSLFMLLLDTLVSFIQAFVFTMLSTLFISMAVLPGHEEKKAAE